MRVTNLGALALASAAMVMVAPIACAQSSDAHDYDMPGQELGEALREVALESRSQLIVPTELVAGLRAPALKGRFTRDEAVSSLLRGSGLRAVTVGGTLVIQRADAQQAEGGRDDGTGEQIVVTGTRIRGKGPVGVSVITIDRRAIAENGFSTAQQIAESVPQNFAGGANEGTTGLLTAAGNGNTGRGAAINLRGLGQMSTLLLLNGDRPPLGGGGGTFSDISMIPASVIERIEIVPDGSSAIYGSDAVAGVVNVVPRLDFRGAETSFRIGTADGASQEYQASQLLGTGWAGGHGVIAYEFYRRDRLAAADRPFATDDLRPFGGLDRRTNYASPGTIYAGGQSFAIPSGQNGVGLTASRLTAGAVNRGDSQFDTDILPEQRRHSVFASISQDLTETLRIYAHGLATWRNFEQALRPASDTRRTVPVTSPFYVDPIGTHQPVGVNYSFVRDLGPETHRGQATALGGSAGLEASFGGWRIDAHGTWGRQSESYVLGNRVNTARLALALADTNPATAYNLFGDGPSTNPATIASIRGYSAGSYYGIVWSATLRADGPLMRLPAGEARLAIGSEYREDRYRNGALVSYVSQLTPTVTAPIPLLDLRTVKSAYAELLVPVFGGDERLPGFYRLDLSAAVRTEEYSDFGRTTNPKLSFSWETVRGLTLRGSYGTSFRAPTFTELRQDPATIGYFAWADADPQSPTGTSNILVIRGNDPNLRPERATSWTLGADLKPGFLPGFHASVTWYNVNYRDRIASPAPNLSNFLINRDIYAPILKPNPTPARIAEIYASPYYLDLTGIPKTATFVAEADARLQNLSVVKQSGLDIDLGYRFDIGGGRAEVGAVGTYIFHILQALTATAKPIDVVSTVGNPVDLRIRGRALWNRRGFDAALFVNFVDGYTNKTTPTPEHVRSWTTFDLNLAYAFKREGGLLHGLRVALNASNILDTDPPYVAYFVGTYTSGYDGENASPLGRVVALQVTKTW